MSKALKRLEKSGLLAHASEGRAYLLQQLIDKLPPKWAAAVREKYQHEVDKKGYLSAIGNVNRVREVLSTLLLDIAHNDDDIKALAEDLAAKCRDAMARYSVNKLWLLDYWQELCVCYGVRYPLENEQDGINARMCCDIWWLRNLRLAHAKAREIAAIDAGLVHCKNNVYVSDDTLERRGQQLRRNAALLNEINLESESGQRMKLADVAAAGMANPDNRRAELMTRITGFEELANKYGHKAEFVTLTCPSRMHAVTKNGKPNPKYDGTKPDQAQKYLVNCWAKARANLAKNGVKFYGLRVVEPHHDGTPHWHLILFYDGKEATRKKLKHYITRQFVEEDRQEIWNNITPRVKFVAIKPSKGTAAGYVVKYVSKNIGGIEGEKPDETDSSSELTSMAAASRVEAWAATWRIRQFQQVGGHSVTVWRELRRVSSDVIATAGQCLSSAWQAAQKTQESKANFAKFIEAMGGLEVLPRESLLRLDDDFIYTKGRYGMGIAHKVKGVCERFGMDRVANNRERWVRV